MESLFSHYSSWDGLLKAISWMVGFMLSRSSKSLQNLPRGPHTVPEVIVVENDIVKVVQDEAFSKEVSALDQTAPGNMTKCLPRTSPIRDLNPYLTEGMLRVGGSFENSPVSFQAKQHPIILPS